VNGNGLIFPVRRLAADGVNAWKQVVERGYVAEDEASAYERGATQRWLKVKVPRLDRSRRPLAPVAAGKAMTAGAQPLPSD
jgi:hypothetical protein